MRPWRLYTREQTHPIAIRRRTIVSLRNGKGFREFYEAARMIMRGTSATKVFVLRGRETESEHVRISYGVYGCFAHYVKRRL